MNITIQNTYYDSLYKCFMRQITIHHKGNLHCRVMGSQRDLHALVAEFGASQVTITREAQPKCWKS